MSVHHCEQIADSPFFSDDDMGAAKTTATAPIQDGRIQSRVENYTGFWEKDSANDTEVQRANRLDQYTDVINGSSSPSSIIDTLVEGAIQGTMTALLSSTSMAGLKVFISPAFTKARLSTNLCGLPSTSC